MDIEQKGHTVSWKLLAKMVLQYLLSVVWQVGLIVLTEDIFSQQQKGNSHITGHLSLPHSITTSLKAFSYILGALGLQDKF